VLAALAPRVAHIHARVGFAEGPQVPDPRGKAWAPWLAGHLRWWDAILAAAAARGDGSFSVTPEFGPPPYCWTQPLGEEPLVDIADVNHYVAREVARLFEARFGPGAAAALAPL
jgi:hypothetical protein